MDNKSLPNAETAVVETALSGYELLNNPVLNKGTAFTDEEREEFDLHGLLPPHVAELDYQVMRRLDAFRGLGRDIQKYVFLRGLQDTNETLFYALLTRNIEEMMPIVYTPTVGLGCQLFSHIFRKPRGLFLSIPHKDCIRRILSHPRYDGVRTIVVSDGERILGLGDQGAGGMGIPIGKLSLYTACAGLHPATTLPIILDVGTDNTEHLSDPLYIGWQHERVRGAEYDELVEMFVSAARERWPHVLLHWEDFAIGNANRLLARYRDQLCTFNDDIQGTAAIAVGTLLSAINVTGTPLREQRIAVLGAGSAGTGICALIVRAMVDAGLSESEARSRFYLVDRDGLLVEGMNALQSFQAPFAQSRDRIASWTRMADGHIGLAEVVSNAKPTVLIGTSGQAHAFHEAVVREMATHVQRPVIFPLSNPTERSEATPADIDAWTEGRAVIGTGSPFPPIERDGKMFRVDQTNNAYVYPGIGLGAIAVKAKRISDAMFLAAARAIAELSPARRDPQANLLPPLVEIRDVTFHVAQAVARQALAEGLAAAMPDDAIAAAIKGVMWEPVYATYHRRRDR
ncbi:MAG TPA: NAD-dependent malic enzyme [Xanthobacteraceae bacterium]|jgi:malate dehydrogenase (oxaloacetate-decarboxylating)|nr:NAD-dependent malic enzyme [Xanthobacteraceae bacterium]